MVNKKKKLKDLVFRILMYEPTTKVKLAKLVLFADIEHYRKTGQSITGLHYIQLTKGPLVFFFDDILEEGEKEGLWEKTVENIPIWEEMKIKPQFTYRIKPSSKLKAIKQIRLSQEELQTVEHIMEEYGKQTGTKLSILAHKLPAWKYSSPGEPMHIAELSIEDEDRYFAFIDIIEELDGEDDHYLAEEVSRLIPEIKK